MILLFATGGGIGNIRFAPGTFGSAAAFPLCFLLSRIPSSLAIPCVVLFVVFAVRVAGEAEKLLNEKDPGCIVIDEIAGMAAALLGLPFTPASCLAGFLLFRAFDILKPFPIKLLEKRLPGGFGIVMDDVVAGMFANLVLRFGLLSIIGQSA